MEEQQDSLPEPQEISIKFESFIKGAVARQFSVPSARLEVIHERAFIHPEKPDKFLFTVLDAEGNNLYGVSTIYNPDTQSLEDYRVGYIDF